MTAPTPSSQARVWMAKYAKVALCRVTSTDRANDTATAPTAITHSALAIRRRKTSPITMMASGQKM